LIFHEFTFSIQFGTFAVRSVKNNEDAMKKLIDRILSLRAVMVSTWREFGSTMDDVNIAWREGKVLEHLQLTLKDRGKHFKTQ
jgi:hypothetical protein